MGHSRVRGTDACVCGSAATWADCCDQVVAGERPATTAEALMRSRFSANVVGDAAHLRRSWHPDTRPADASPTPGLEWTGLTIVATERGRGLDADGVVEFRATWRRADGTTGVLHERSRFCRVDGRWVYVDGDIIAG